MVGPAGKINILFKLIEYSSYGLHSILATAVHTAYRPHSLYKATLKWTETHHSSHVTGCKGLEKRTVQKL